MSFTESIGCDWTVYGFQPRGMDPPESPDQSVESAATNNLNAIVALGTDARIHIVAHSYGGLVAYEMATQLFKKGRPANSITLVDTDPPESTWEDHGEGYIRKQFIAALEQSFGKSLSLENEAMLGETAEQFIQATHLALRRAKCVADRSNSAMLNGPFATFRVAFRTRYIPTARYPGKLHLALVRDPALPDPEDRIRRKKLVSQWQLHAQEVHVWHGPGNHYSILKAPFVSNLARWWLEVRAGSECAVSV
jgi:arthrofactin-type cyclic lipopeptide synthetase C